MLKFFGRARQQLLTENKFSKYLLYAIGEIFLVVIGILIALWINNLNNVSQKKEKGDIILSEIRENLISDTLLIQEIAVFNLQKKASLFKFLQIASEKEFTKELNDELFQLMQGKLGNLWTYKTFYAKNIGFTNLTSAGNIELITNIELRSQLSQYYLNLSSDFAAQASSLIISNSLKNYIFPKLMSNEFVKNLTGLEFQLQDIEDIRLNDDEKLVSDLGLLIANIDYDAEAFSELKIKLTHLIEMINEELKES